MLVECGAEVVVGASGREDALVDAGKGMGKGRDTFGARFFFRLLFAAWCSSPAVEDGVPLVLGPDSMDQGAPTLVLGSDGAVHGITAPLLRPRSAMLGREFGSAGTPPVKSASFPPRVPGSSMRGSTRIFCRRRFRSARRSAAMNRREMTTRPPIVAPTIMPTGGPDDEEVLEGEGTAVVSAIDNEDEVTEVGTELAFVL